MSSCLPGHSLALTSLSFSFQLSPVIKYRLNVLNVQNELNVYFQSPLILVLLSLLVLLSFECSFDLSFFSFAPSPPQSIPPLSLSSTVRGSLFSFTSISSTGLPPPLSPCPPVPRYSSVSLCCRFLLYAGWVVWHWVTKARRGEARRNSFLYNFCFCFLFLFLCLGAPF